MLNASGDAAKTMVIPVPWNRAVDDHVVILPAWARVAGGLVQVGQIVGVAEAAWPEGVMQADGLDVGVQV